MVEPNSNENQPPSDKPDEHGENASPGKDEPLLDPHGFPIGRQVPSSQAAPPVEPPAKTPEEPGVLPEPDPDMANMELSDPLPQKMEAFMDNTINGDDIDNDVDGGLEEAIEEEDPRIFELQKQLDNMRDQALRALAEAENTRRRAQKEREDATRYSISSFARDMLEISDNLRRGIEAIPDDLKETDPRLQNVIEGIEATERGLIRAFDRHGIEKLEPTDEIFDPNFHEVMFEAPSTGKPAGTIIQLIEPGYMLKDRLLRPARVAVAKDEYQHYLNDLP